MKKIKLKKTSFKKAYIRTRFKTETEFIAFLNKEKNNNLTKKDFKEANIDWTELATIFDDHSSRFEQLNAVGKTISPILQSIPATHSVRVRIKNPASLVYKIIRKRRYEGKNIEYKNYREEITDLIGVRVLHLLKDEWRNIHEYINKLWEPKEAVANIRNGDDPKYTELYKKYGLIVDDKKRNYRSVHYIVKSSITKEIFPVEIQVRTLYEEAWSELDHILNYPCEAPQVVQGVLGILNRLAGTADEMAAFAKYSHNLHKQIDVDIKKKDTELSFARKELKQATDKLDTKSTDNEKVRQALKKLEEKLDSYNVKNSNIINAGSAFDYKDYLLDNSHITVSTDGVLKYQNSISDYTGIMNRKCSCGNDIESYSISDKCSTCQRNDFGLGYIIRQNHT